MPLAALAQAWPEKPVKIIVPFGPGGFTDVAARILQKELSASLGQSVIIENKPGAGSTIGTADVANAKPDGYTLAMISTTHVISPHLYKQMPYDPIRGFAPVMKLAEGPYVLVVHPSLPAKSVAELLALARAEPGRIDYASSGNGSSQHLVGALFNSTAKVQMNHVPYKGSNQAMNDLIGGQVKVSFVGVPNALPNLANGKLKALAVSSAKRYAELPDVPTIAEAGLAGYDATIWLGLLAPRERHARSSRRSMRRSRRCWPRRKHGSSCLRRAWTWPRARRKNSARYCAPSSTDGERW
jgi:tripartite-type tricarboxylate transporter receptor subunit TctC